METNELGRDRGASRRRFLQAGAAGAAMSLALPLVAQTASAQADTRPPRRPTDGDLASLRFAQGVELAARDLYELALAGGGYGDELAVVMATMSNHHRSYAEAISGLLGRDADGRRNDGVFGQFQSRFSSTSTSLDAAFRLEDTAVATHTALLGRLEGIEGAALIASILVVEARHATVLAGEAGITDLNQLLSTSSNPLEVTA